MKPQVLKLAVGEGFTLLEVMVATAIVGLGVVTLLEVFSMGLRLGARSSERTEAVAYARQVMDGLLARRELREGSEEGPLGRRYRWRVQVDPFDDRPALQLSARWKLVEVTLDFQGQSRRGPKVQMKTLRLVRRENP